MDLKIILILLLILIVIYILLTYSLFLTGFRRFRGNRAPKKATDHSSGKAWKAYGDVIRAGTEWFKAQPYENVEIRSFDGLRLRAMLLEADAPRGVIVSMHGYRSTPLRDLGASSKYYHDLGFTLLLPNQRACGESEGRYLTFGAKERYDVKSWCEYAAGRYGKDMPIIVAGISLGCSSVLMSLDLGLPENVKAAVADCGYSSLYGELSDVAGKSFHLRPKPVLWGVNIWCRLIADFDIYKCTTIDSLKKSKIPVLFIHGEADNYVPTCFSRENYEACAAPKELFTVPGAGHGLSYLVDTDGYRRHLETWFDRYCPRKDTVHEPKNA